MTNNMRKNRKFRFWHANTLKQTLFRFFECVCFPEPVPFREASSTEYLEARDCKKRKIGERGDHGPRFEMA